MLESLLAALEKAVLESLLAVFEKAVRESLLAVLRKSSAGRPVSARQEAQQLKKQRFNKVINDIARNKAFFMSFIRHPCMQTLEGLKLFLDALEEYKNIETYQALQRQSVKRTEERTQLKRKRDDGRLKLRHGKRDVEQGRNTELADLFKVGALARECKAAEDMYSYGQKLEGMGRFLGNRVGR